MNGLDLNLFQFDYDQTWAVMFFRHDGTILARYGTRGDKDGMKYNSLEGFTSTMRRVLEVERNWDPNEAVRYAGKHGPKVEFATADSIPSATVRRIQSQDKTDGRKSCIHCHNVYDAMRDVSIDRGEYDPTVRYKYPLPGNIGLDVDSDLQVSAIEAGSAAALAGIQVGQTVMRMNGQNIHSVADMQFVLHHVGDPGKVEVEVADARNLVTHQLSLPKGWRVSDIGWRASMYGMPPKPGLWIQALSDSERQAAGLKPDKMALKIRGKFGKDVRASQLKNGDIIVRMADDDSHHSEGAFHAHLRLNYYRRDSKLPLRVLRDGKPLDVTVTFPNANPER